MNLKRELSGVLTKTGKGFILYNHKGEINLTEVLETFWQTGENVHIRIEMNADVVLMNERDCEIYLDKDTKGKYKYHINGWNIEDLLEAGIYQQIDVLIETQKRKDNGHGQREYNKS